MRYLNTILGLIIHSLLILFAYAPLFMLFGDLRFNEIYPVIILFWILSINEIFLAVTPSSVMILPVCSFSFTMIIGFIISHTFPWIYPFLIIGLLFFVLGVFLQFLITLI